MTIVRFPCGPSIAALLLVAACGDSSGTSGTGEGGGSGSGGAAASGTGGEGAGGSDPSFVEGEPSVPCMRYVECVAATSPATLEQVTAQYGEDGDCWSSESLADACTTGCLDALGEAHAAFPDEDRCTACDVDADCVDPAAPRCLAGACHACIEAADCVGAAGGPACVDFVCSPDPGPACLAQVLRAISGQPISGDCIVASCQAEYDALFAAGGICAGVDPCGEGIGCIEGASGTPFEACIEAHCSG